MAFRFFRRVKIAPGVHVNLSRSGGSVSVGPRGAKVTAGPRGVRGTAGIPGTGMHWTREVRGGRARGGGRSDGRSSRRPAPPRRSAEGTPLDLGFLERLFTPKSERRLVDALRAWVEGDRAGAERRLAAIAAQEPDAAFVAAGLAMEAGRGRAARARLERALAGRRTLGRRLGEYGIDAALDIEVADGVTARATPDERGVRLALVEVLQAPPVRDRAAAIEHARALVRMGADDVLARLSLAELLIEHAEDERVSVRGRRAALRRVLELAARIENETAVHAALLLQRGRACRLLGMHDGARDALNAALRRRKDRPADLLRAVRYERGVAHEQAGRRAAARRDLERLVAEDPAYEDAADRLDALRSGRRRASAASGR